MIREVQADGRLLPPGLDMYDLYALVFLLIGLIAVFSLLMWLLGLPGRIAIQRRHPHAEAVKIMGYAGGLAIVPWIHAFIWAFHDSATVDVRRFPKAQELATDEEIRRLTQHDKRAGDHPPSATQGSRTDAKTPHTA